MDDDRQGFRQRAWVGGRLAHRRRSSRVCSSAIDRERSGPSGELSATFNSIELAPRVGASSLLSVEDARAGCVDNADEPSAMGS